MKRSVGFVLVAAVVTSCGTTERVEPPADTVDWTELSIARGTVGRAGDLSIGVIAVRAGRASRGGTVALAFSLANAGRDETRELRVGQREEILGYPIVVVELRTGGTIDGLGPPGSSSGEAVTLRVGRATSAGPCPLSSASPSPGRPAATIDPRPVVCPTSVTLRVGETQRFFAAQQEAGRIAATPRVTWSVDPPTLGAISDDGVFTAKSAGSGHVTATTLIGSVPLTGTAAVTVR